MVGRAAPGLSGSYAAVSVASKALVFGAIVLGGYLLPEAAIRWRQGGHALRQLAVTLLLLAVPAVLLLVVALGAPHLLVSVVFSSRYLGAERAFVPLVLAMVCLSITVVLTMYLLAVGRRWITVLLVVGAGAVTLAVVHAHGVPQTTARADLAVQAGPGPGHRGGLCPGPPPTPAASLIDVTTDSGHCTARGLRPPAGAGRPPATMKHHELAGRLRSVRWSFS